MICPHCGNQMVDIKRWKRIDAARRAGVSWRDIAERFGYANRKSAWIAFHIAGKKHLEDKQHAEV